VIVGQGTHRPTSRLSQVASRTAVGARLSASVLFYPSSVERRLCFVSSTVSDKLLRFRARAKRKIKLYKLCPGRVHRHHGEKATKFVRLEGLPADACMASDAQYREMCDNNNYRFDIH